MLYILFDEENGSILTTKEDNKETIVYFDSFGLAIEYKRRMNIPSFKVERMCIACPRMQQTEHGLLVHVPCEIEIALKELNHTKN